MRKIPKSWTIYVSADRENPYGFDSKKGEWYVTWLGISKKGIFHIFLHETVKGDYEDLEHSVQKKQKDLGVNVKTVMLYKEKCTYFSRGELSGLVYDFLGKGVNEFISS